MSSETFSKCILYDYSIRTQSCLQATSRQLTIHWQFNRIGNDTYFYISALKPVSTNRTYHKNRSQNNMASWGSGTTSPHRAVGWSAVCDRRISLSYFLTFLWMSQQYMKVNDTSLGRTNVQEAYFLRACHISLVWHFLRVLVHLLV